MSVPGAEPVSTAALCRLVLRSAVGVSPSLSSAINQQTTELFKSINC